ncbi:MAG: hypothetical protein IE923_18445 [Micrococcales bacterium]|nr:hypothetical protein [Micrococcales bacterium]
MVTDDDRPARRTRDDIDDLLGEQPHAPASAGGKPEDEVKRRLAVLAEFWGHPDPGVFSWQDAPDATRWAALIRVQRFTEWLIATFDVREIKPCWTLHPGVVAELWALERLHHATHVVSTDPGGPVAFLNQLPTTRARLRTDTGMDTCSSTDHTVPMRELAERVDARRAPYEVGDRFTAAWAWPSVDDAGQPVPAPLHTRRQSP